MTRKNSKGTVPERVNVQAMLEDEQGDLLIGTWQDGLYRYAVKTRTFTHYPQEEVKSVLSLFQDSRGVMDWNQWKRSAQGTFFFGQETYHRQHIPA